MTNKIKNRKINCHIRTCSRYPEKWIPGINPRMTLCGEVGRSMVEMLGVLAVMGVLSVGGVAMYTNAMNKYRANELLNEASKRAVMVAGQLLTNPNATTMSLFQFGSNAVAGATFGENATISNGKITLTFETAPDEAICNQMIAATGTNSAMQVASGCGTITFNTDMSKGVSTGGTSTADGWTDDDGSDCTGDTKLGGTNSCQVCVNGSYVDSDAKCTTNGQICLDGSCTTPSGTSGCLKNSDCDDGEFCDYEQNVHCGNGPNGQGTCKSATTYQTLTVADDGIAGILSNSALDWFSAKKFCQANGRSMISLSGSGINASTLGSYFNNNGYCYGTGAEKCEGVTWSNYKGKLASTYWWTKDLTDGANSSDAFYVGTYDSGVSGSPRSDNGYYALCK